MSKHTIELAPGGPNAGLLITTPEGKIFPLSPDRDGMDLLVGYLRRHKEHQTTVPEKIFSLPWPPHSWANFNPPALSPWRKTPWWPTGQAYITVRIICETTNGYIKVRLFCANAPEAVQVQASYLVPSDPHGTPTVTPSRHTPSGAKSANADPTELLTTLGL